MSTTEVSYAPDAGDLIWTDFDPRTGREQSGRRPALVLSAAAFCRASDFVIVCPITRHVRRFGSSVLLPPDLAVAGEIPTSHARSLDASTRPIRFTGERAPAATLAEVRGKLATLCGISN